MFGKILKISALIVILSAQVLVAQTVRISPGGADTGGTDVSTYLPIEFTDQHIKNLIEAAHAILPKLFRGMDVDRAEDYQGGGKAAICENKKYDNNCKLAAKTLKAVLADPELYQTIKRLHFIPQQAPCLDSDGVEKAASIFNQPENDVCVSYGVLKERFNDKTFVKANDFVEVIAAMAHEVIHKRKIKSELIAGLIQQAILDEYTHLRFFRNQLRGIPIYNDVISVSMMEGYYASQADDLHWMETRNTALLQSLVEILKIQDPVSVCEELYDLNSEFQDIITMHENQSEVVFGTLDREAFNLIRVAQAQAYISMSYCRSKESLDRKKDRYGGLPSLFEHIADGESGSLMWASASYPEVTVRRVKYGDRAGFDAQLNEAIENLNKVGSKQAEFIGLLVKYNGGKNE